MRELVGIHYIEPIEILAMRWALRRWVGIVIVAISARLWVLVVAILSDPGEDGLAVAGLGALCLFVSKHIRPV